MQPKTNFNVIDAETGKQMIVQARSPKQALLTVYAAVETADFLHEHLPEPQTIPTHQQNLFKHLLGKWFVLESIGAVA